MILARKLSGLVPKPARPFVRSVYRSVKAAASDGRSWLAARSRVYRSIYYGWFSPAFSGEQRAVAAGRFAYSQSLRRRRRSSFLLRRNIHRLEKGLVVRQRRAVFALDFIGETVEEFKAVAAVAAESGTFSPEFIWANDVLAEYFDAVDTLHPVLRKELARFDNARRTVGYFTTSSVVSVPFRRDLQTNPVAVADLHALAVRRRSVRSFLEKPVARELVDLAVRVAALSPSACNRQAFRFLLFDNPETAQRVAAIPAGTKTFVNEIRAVAVLVGRLRAYPRERDRHAVYVDASLASMAFILAMEAQGLATCAINWADEEPAESRITAILNLESDERVILMIAYGWPDPDAKVPFSAKRELDELREYDRPCKN